MSLLNRIWSGLDFWDKEENKRQRQQFAQPKKNPSPVQVSRPTNTQRQSAIQPTVSRPSQRNTIKSTFNTGIEDIRTNINDLTVAKPKVPPMIARPQEKKPLTTKQAVDATYGSGVTGIRNRVRDMFDANTEADHIRRQAKSGLRENYYDQQNRLREQQKQRDIQAAQNRKYSQSLPTKALNTLTTGTMRGAAGAGQAAGGLYDMLTPGKGNNRLTQYFKNRGEVWDKTAESAKLNNAAYRVSQAPITLASFAAGDKGLTKAGGVMMGGAKALPVAGSIISKADDAVRLATNARLGGITTKLDDVMANGSRLQRVGANLARSYTRPGTMGNITALNTLQNAGERTSRGEDNNLGTFAQDIALGLAMQGGVNLAGQAAGGVIRGARNTVDNIRTAPMADRLTAARERLRLQNQGGYIAGPGALGFNDAKAKGLVFDGVDGKPRFEVDDSGASLNNEQFSWGLKMDNQPRKIGDILKHDKMFEQYPELKDVNVRYEPNNIPGHDAHYDPDTNSIVITKSKADEGHLSDIIHELQHTIQEKEGFARGGSPDYRNYAAENASIKRGLQDVNTTLSGKNLTPEQTRRLRKRRDNLIKQLEETQDQYGNVYTKAKDLAEYRRLAGEAEARAVQARMNMPMSERYVKTKPSTAVEGVPKELQGLHLTDRLPDNDLKVLPDNGVYFEGKLVKQFGNQNEAWNWVYALEDNPAYQKYVKSNSSNLKARTAAAAIERNRKRDVSKSAIRNSDGSIKTVYHATNSKPFAEFKNGSEAISDVGRDTGDVGVYFSSEPDKFYGSNVIAAQLDVRKPYQAPNGFKAETLSDAEVKFLKDNGYDGVVSSQGEIVALSPDQVKIISYNDKPIESYFDTPKPRSTFYDSLDVPKEDLIIRNGDGKAMSIDPLESLKQEARKYKSAEEFIEASRSITDFDRDAVRKIFKNVKPGDGETGVKKALTEFYNQATAPKTKGVDAVALKSEAKAVPKYMQDKVTPEGYFTEGRYKDSAYPKNFVAIEDVPSTNIKAGDKVALIKGRDGRFDAILDKSYKESSTGYTISRESFVDPSKFTNTNAPQPTKGASTPQRQVVNSTVQESLDNQVRTPNQSQSLDSSQLPRKNLGAQSFEPQQQTPSQGKTQNTPVTQNSQSSTSSDNIIDLKTIDVNDPFRNNSITQKFRNEFGKYFVDEDTEMINLLKRVEKETGSKDLVEQWLQDTDLVRASNSIANSKLRNNQNLSNALNGLRKKDLADFDRYASARSELSNVERGLTSTSQSLDSLQKTVNDLGGKFSKRFDSLNRYYNDLSNDLYEAGVIDRATRDKWAKNKDYVRVQRDMEDLLSPQVGSSRSRSFGSTSTSKKRTGSQRDILSSTQTALKRGQEIQLEIQRNKAATNIIDTLTKYGIAEKIPSTQATGKNVIKRFKDGKVEYFATSKDIKRVIDNVNPIQLGVIARVISAPTRLFRAGTTALSAPFAVTNYARDQMSSAIYSKNVLATHNPKTIVSGLYGALKDFGGVQNDPLWKKFEQIAGDQTIFDELRNSKNSKKMLAEIRRGGGGKARVAELVNPLNTVRTLEDLIGVTEKSTRFQNFKGIYEKAKRQGVSEDVAIRRATQAALQNSVNFSRAGQVTRIANLMFPYFNAGIQGSRNVGRSLRDRPVATTAKSVAFLGIPALAAALYNYEDKDRRRIYENIPETEKENGFVFVLPGAKQREDGTYEGIIKIPKPQGYRELTDPLRVVAEAFAGAEDSKSVAEMLKDMVPAFSGPIQTSDMNKFTSTFVPQMVKPALQAHLNKDLYWGSDTVPEYMVEGTEDATKRAYKSTSGMARFIADRLGVSPIQVEKAIIDTTGSLGRYGINAVDTQLAAAGKIPQEQIGGRSIADDFSRRMFEARGVEKEEKNMSSGQKYFKAVKEATSGLKPQQKTAWDSYNQSNKNFLGEVLYDKNSQAKKQAKAAAYIDHPELFQVDKKIDAESRKRGEPGNPLYDLTYQQALMVVQQKALPPGAKDEGLNTLYDQAWYQKFKNDEDKFYEQVFAGKEDNRDNPYPTRSKELTEAMDYYYSLPSSYAKGQFKKANPGIAEQMDAYYEAKDNWTNTERAKLGLPPLPADKYGSSGGSRGKGGSRKGGSRGRKAAAGTYRSPYDLSTQTALNKLISQAGKGLSAGRVAQPKFKQAPMRSFNSVVLAKASTRKPKTNTRKTKA